MRSRWLFAIVFVLSSCAVNPNERNNTGNQLTNSGEYERAIVAYQAAQIADPDNTLFYFNASNALVGADRIEDAEATLQLVIERGEPDLVADAWYNLGVLYFETEAIDEAIEAYREALRIDPTHENARYNLELAMSLEIPPSPTAVEMQSELNEENVNEEATPTPNPAGQVLPTPTPTPREDQPPPGPSPENIGDDESGERSENPSEVDDMPDGEMNVEDAEDMLEPIEADYERISTFRENYNDTGNPPSNKDW